MVRTVTQCLLLAVAALAGAYDLWAVATAGYDASISVVVLDWSHRAPVLPFAAGVLAGHLFWPQSDKEKS